MIFSNNQRPILVACPATAVPEGVTCPFSVAPTPAGLGFRHYARKQSKQRRSDSRHACLLHKSVLTLLRRCLRYTSNNIIWQLPLYARDPAYKANTASLPTTTQQASPYHHALSPSRESRSQACCHHHALCAHKTPCQHLHLRESNPTHRQATCRHPYSNSPASTRIFDAYYRCPVRSHPRHP